MLECVYSSDWHKEAYPFLKGDMRPLYKVLKQMIRYMKINGVSIAIVGGDIFNTPFPSQKNVKKLISFISKHKWINWYFIIGNHDYHDDKNNSLLTLKMVGKWLPNLKVYDKPKLLKINDINCFMAPFPTKAAPKTKFSKICFGHEAAPGAMGDNRRILKEGIIIEKDFWVLGHLHLHQQTEKYTFSGSPLQLNFGENQDKGFLHLKIKNKEDTIKVKSNFIKFQLPFKLHTCLIETDRDLQNLKLNKTDFYKLRLNGVSLPSDFLSNNPNIIKIEGYSKQEALNDDNEEKQKFDFSFDPKKNLRSYLRDKNQKLSDCRKAETLLDEIIQKINYIG